MNNPIAELPHSITPPLQINMNRYAGKWKAWTLAVATLVSLVAGSAQASVVIGGTRVVYPEKDREVTVRLTNEGEKPALVQAWIDAGNANALPDETNAPFILTPPLFRIDPGQGQSLRVLYTKDALPQHRESLFWLNVLEVPPEAENAEAQPNALQLAFRSRIKLFFRPAALESSAADAPSKVTWKLARIDGGRYGLEAHNPTPYHVTFSRVALKTGDTVRTNLLGGMVDPGATATFGIDGLTALPGGPVEVDYTYLDDYGTGVAGKAVPQPAR
ncbi:pili assembly chaperone [Burkholderia multivorans CGD2M]|uniref:Pili assembly chaperone n=2 Tax=Burkholderia multivorans TaxID=87883 RepID=B9BW68_9BURK|nr:pili assembly chaperone [Burkholderia multivorans CGD2]EEE10724.1 pili assembly chaperone [Burkholderia multivorans CGD2M]